MSLCIVNTTIVHYIMKSVVYLLLLDVVAAVQAKGTGMFWNMVISDTLNLTEIRQDQVEKDIRFFLYRRINSNQFIEINRSTINQVNKDRPVKLIVHGWLESAFVEWVQNMTKEYLKKDDYNVILVDYNKVAYEKFSVAVNHSQLVGALIGKLIVNLHCDYQLPLANFHIIGHSLGAHVSGYAGKQVIKLIGSKILRITALDATGPEFEDLSIGLKKGDAKIVDAIHVDGGEFGYKSSLGLTDFFPNGGTAPQPGCASVVQNLDKLFCSHKTSHLYFTNSINKEKFVSTKCSSWSNFERGDCSSNFKMLMGDDYTYSINATGNFYLKTNPN